ncbi:MAG TPA: hypothetical protein VL051_14380 [Burkholderiaceae bacterium]|nr:hypothetical protein [Burkholderiaceae bacterium]
MFAISHLPVVTAVTLMLRRALSAKAAYATVASVKKSTIDPQGESV